MTDNPLVEELKNAFNASREIFSEARSANEDLKDIEQLNKNQHVLRSFLKTTYCTTLFLNSRQHV